MRCAAAAILLLLSACATAPPPERLAGCWIARAEHETRATMRWHPDATRPGVMMGDLLTYGPDGATARHFTIEPRDKGWILCAQDGASAAEPLCRPVAVGHSGSLEGGRVFIDTFHDTLRITVIGQGPELVIFRGERDGCD